MNAFRVGVRATARAARPRPGLSAAFRATQFPRFQPRRTIFQGPQYTRFGGKGGQQQQQQWSRIGPIYRAQYIWRNYRNPILVVTGAGGAVYVYNLEDVPVTHRRRFNIISPEAEKEMMGGKQAYEQVLNEFGGRILPSDHPYTKLVARVVERLLPATGGLAGDDWRVHVIADDAQKNAFVMPGGKVFVFTGILPICQDENGLATVLGHEIAHNVAHHASERLSRMSFFTLPTIIASILLGIDTQFGTSIMNLLLTLPNSRTQENEADHIGLLIMAQSCYDPSKAVEFWERMRKAEQFAPPQFLSTHPSNYNRIDHIRQLLPAAEAVYEEKGCSSMGGYISQIKQTMGLGQSGGRQVGRQSPQPVVIRRNDDDDDDFF